MGTYLVPHNLKKCGTSALTALSVPHNPTMYGTGASQFLDVRHPCPRAHKKTRGHGCLTI